MKYFLGSTDVRSLWAPLRRAGSLVLLLPVLFGCQDPPEARELTSLRRSGEATFVCIGPDRKGSPLSACPQGPRGADQGLTVGAEGHSLYSLVTQTLSAEVAVIRVASTDDGGDSNGRVLDVDPTNPGVTPLRVGQKPTDIVSTPGGRANFVGVGEVGLEGIYALPTTCLFTPQEGEPRRDRTSWPACSLSSVPGAIEMLVDAAAQDGAIREYCGSGPSDDLPWAEADGQCRVDLSEEQALPGRRKLLVALPQEGKLVVLDAQEILNREVGTYAPCHVEAELILTASVPDLIQQPLPPDLVSEEQAWATYDQLGGSYQARPWGMAVSGDKILVADANAPVLHRIDAADVCAPVELGPLYATSYVEPSRVVTTSRVAISPKSPSGAQFAYAVDEVGDGLGNIIVYDVSDTSGTTTPLVKPGAALFPHEAPDRIEFGSAVKDVSFALLSSSIIDPVTGVATTGVLCDPDPATSGLAPGAQYRPSSDTVGAGPTVLRGLFGYALLGNGAVGVIDVEDFDAACRRPRYPNRTSEMDFRGCVDDELGSDYYTENGQVDGNPTVTDEVSCRAVVPHRPRSALTLETSETDGIRSPALSRFGRLSQRGRGLSVSRLTTEGKRSPIVLGTDFEAPGGGAQPGQVYIGSVLYTRGDLSDPLDTDANTADRATMVLPYTEPRAYPSDDLVSVIYEGQLDRTRRTGILAEASTQTGTALLRDSNVSFCALGVQDRALTMEVGVRQFSLGSGPAERFADRHTDYIQITNRLFDEEDGYWSEAGAACGEPADGEFGTAFELCDSAFGEGDEDELSDARDFSIVSATRDVLELTPRHPDARSAANHLNLVRCCFPEALSYRIRAGHQWVVKGSRGGFEHAVITDEESDEAACIFDRSPRRSGLRGRAFEVSSVKCDNLQADDVDACGVGLRTSADVVCSYDATQGPVEVGGVASECIFDGLNRRFVVYRGLDPSERDMAFEFEVVGGFRSQLISLTQSSVIVLPVSLAPIPTYGALGVVDSQNRGLMMIDLPNLHVAQSFY